MKVTRLGLVLAILAAAPQFIQSASAGCPQGNAVRYRRAAAAPALSKGSATNTRPTTQGNAEVSPEEETPKLWANRSYQLEANFLGEEAGYVLIHANGVAIQAEVEEWTPDSVTFAMPNIGLVATAPARLDVILPDGRVVESTHVWLMKKKNGITPVAAPARRLQETSQMDALEPDDSAPAEAATHGALLRSTTRIGS